MGAEPILDRWRRLEAIFHEVSEVPADKAGRLEALCGGDRELLEEARELLRACEEESHASEGYAPPAAPADAQLGHRLGPYRLDRIIGRGGLGAVYLAHRADGEFEQQVAIKIVGLPFELEAFRERFRRERQILAGLNHPNITRLLDGGVTGDGQLYLVMEYIDGVPIDKFETDFHGKLDLFLGVCAAVQYAHQNLIVHRDIKPSNILVNADGTPKLLDFGAAKLMDDVEVTRTGLGMMTIAYASPEQLRGAPATTLSDVYSLGALLYELISGEKALGEDLTARVRAFESGGQLKLARRLPGELGQVVEKALAPVPGERYSSVEQLAEDVRRYRDGQPVLAHPPSFGYQARKFLSRHWLASAAAAVFVVGLAASAMYSLRQRELARQEAMRAVGSNRFLVSLLNNGTGLGKQATIEKFTDSTAKQIDQLAAAGALEPEAEAYARSALTYSFAIYGDLPGARAQMDRMAALAERDGSARLRYLAALARGQVFSLEGRDREADDSGLAAYSIAKTELAQDQETVADGLEAYLFFHRNALASSAKQLPEETIALYRELVDRGRRSPSKADLLRYLIDACTAFLDSGFQRDGSRYCEEALTLQENLPRNSQLESVYFMLAQAAEREGDWKTGVVYRRKQFDLAMVVNGAQSPSGRSARAALGRDEFMSGERAAGLARTGAAVEEMAAEGGKLEVYLPLSHYADMLARSGRGPEAEQWARRVLDTPNHDGHLQALSALAEALAVQGKYPEAATAFEEALNVAKSYRGMERRTKQLTEYLEKARRDEPPF